MFKIAYGLVEYIVSSNLQQLCQLWLKRSNKGGCTRDKAGQSVRNKRPVVSTKNDGMKV